MTVLPDPVHAFGYDFRRSNFDSGDALLAFIANVIASHPGAEQVILVTHSMGGLVARAATHVLFSDGVKTDAQVDFTPSSSIAVSQTNSGDGTVPASNGRCPNIPAIKSTTSFNGLLHAAVDQDAGFNSTAIDKVRLILSSP